MHDLKEGLLSPLRAAIAADRDLLLEIRREKINVYFKGHSLLALERKSAGYSITLNESFRKASDIPSRWSDSGDTERFVAAIPSLKTKVLARGRGGSEIEYEQLLIRANNGEARLNTEYFIIDRQIVTQDKKGRFDLVALHWPRGRKPDQKVCLALLEVKYGLNNDIKQLHRQLKGYYDSVKADLEGLCDEAEGLLQQKLELGLFAGARGRLAALGTLEIVRDIRRVHFGIVLVDYNPGSKLLDIEVLRGLPFAEQVVLFHVGFGLWGKRGQAL
jgi:hypothetical protein